MTQQNGQRILLFINGECVLISGQPEIPLLLFPWSCRLVTIVRSTVTVE